MLWMDQQYHNAIRDGRKPNQHLHETLDVKKPTQTQAPIRQSDLYHGSLYLSIEFLESSVFKVHNICAIFECNLS